MFKLKIYKSDVRTIIYLISQRGYTLQNLYIWLVNSKS